MKKITRNKNSESGGVAGKVRYAVVGLGFIAQSAVLPAFRNAKSNSQLTALVSDDPKKLATLGRKYGVSVLAGYDKFQEVLKDVDAVYISLPNTLHRAYTELAAEAGVHVLCEKPLALDESDCRAMIDVCSAGRVHLMSAYRLHFERANLEAIRIAHTRLGELRMFTASFSNSVDAGNLRLRAGEGGPLFDIGIYCLNAARSLFREEPIEVSAFAASGRDPRFAQVPEMINVILRFPNDRLASFTCSFGAFSGGWYEITGTKGSLRVEPAYDIAADLGHTLRIGKRQIKKVVPARDQFAPELLYFSDCVLKGHTPEPSGEEGLADVRVLNAIERSVQEQRPIKLEPFKRSKHPSMLLEIARPAPAEVALVHAKEPSTT